MGQLYAFRCPQCGYYAELCGGIEYGFAGALRTILCSQCMALYDVRSWNSRTGKEVPLRCPKKAGHMIVVWKQPGPCPKCGNVLVNEGETALWD